MDRIAATSRSHMAITSTIWSTVYCITRATIIVIVMERLML